MKNYEVVHEVRDVLFYFQKEYASIEFNNRILNHNEIDSRTFTYLEKVKNLFDDFGDTIGELQKYYMQVVAGSIDNKENKNAQD